MKILFGSDGSAMAESAVRFGALVAGACHAEASLLGICEVVGREDRLLESLRRSQAVLAGQQVTTELITKTGRPVPELARRAQESAYDLVVVGAERKADRGQFPLSARAYRIIEAVAPPVLVVMVERPALRRILLCSGGAGHGDAAVDLTGQIAQALGAPVDLFHVLAAPPAVYANLIRREQDTERLLQSDSALARQLRQQQNRLVAAGVACEIHLRQGLVLEELRKELRQHDHDLVVAGSAPARERWRRYVLGDLTRDIVNHAARPVLVVRPPPRSGVWNELAQLTGRLFGGRPGDSEAKT